MNGKTILGILVAGAFVLGAWRWGPGLLRGILGVEPQGPAAPQRLQALAKDRGTGEQQDREPQPAGRHHGADRAILMPNHGHFGTSPNGWNAGS